MTASQASGPEAAPGARRSLLWSFAASAAMHGALLYAIANEEVGLARIPPGLMLVHLTSGASGHPDAGGRGSEGAVTPQISAGQIERSTLHETEKRSEPPADGEHAKAPALTRAAQAPTRPKAVSQPSRPAPKEPRDSDHEHASRASQPVATSGSAPADSPDSPVKAADYPSDVSAMGAGGPGGDTSLLASAGPVTGGAAGIGAGRSGGGGLGDGGVARGSYYELLSAWLERYKQYPDLARRRGLEGTASLRVAIRRDGSVISAALQAPSRHDVLDRAALDLVRRAEPFPRMPSDLAGDRFEFVVPIHFHLDRRG